MNSVAQYVDAFRSAKVETPQEVQRALDIDDRSRTSVLPWKGQFSPQLIDYLLGRHQGQRVLDPFCGSGTVLYEAAAHGRAAVGIDVNPAAVVLASLAQFCMMPLRERLVLAHDGKQTVLKELAMYNKDIIGLDFCQNLPDGPLYKCFLLLLFGDKKEIAASKAEPTWRQLAAKLVSLPLTETGIRALSGDARYTPFDNGSFDLVITSPPYINVFNYHQNYRPVMESLGHAPLSIARAEIGANRKHRQNRFLTVIQYCIDMEAVFAELWRLLSPGGEAVFIVGHSSKVRGVSFNNSELIAAVAVLSGAFTLVQKNERAFVNRFGERIGEDVLVLHRNDKQSVDFGNCIGRAVGSQALSAALEQCDDNEVKEEITDAYRKGDSVEGSPRII